MTSIAARILFAATLLAFSVPLAGSAARADVVTEWNVIALNATTIPPNSVLQSRTIAIVHAAIYDAANAIERKGGAYAVDLKAAPGTSLDAAVAAAAHGALVRLVPAQRAALDAALDATLAKIPDGLGKTDGITIGSQIAERMVALRSSDGSDAKVAFARTTGAGGYPSAHATFSGAAEAVLKGFFGRDTVNVSVTFPGPFGVTRTYTSFSAITEEVDNARVWGGIHFRSADLDGSEVGRKIGAVVMCEFPKPATN